MSKLKQSRPLREGSNFSNKASAGDLRAARTCKTQLRALELLRARLFAHPLAHHAAPSELGLTSA